MEDNLKISDNLKINIEFKTNIIITKDDIDDIMSTALEGGITYWCDRCSVVGNISVNTQANKSLEVEHLGFVIAKLVNYSSCHSQNLSKA